MFAHEGFTDTGASLRLECSIIALGVFTYDYDGINELFRSTSIFEAWEH